MDVGADDACADPTQNKADAQGKQNGGTQGNVNVF